jgi:transposase
MTREGNKALGGALGIGALSASQCRNSYLSGRYHRLASRRGKQRAIVAVEHSILIAVWHMLTNNVDYQKLCANHFSRRDPGRTLRRITRQANTLGFTVRFDPIPLPAPQADTPVTNRFRVRQRTQLRGHFRRVNSLP